MAKATQQAKAPAKKVATKEVTTKKGDFVAKKIGANLIVTIEGSKDERYPKKVTQEEGQVILDKMKAYNKRPSKAKKEEIIALLRPEKAAAKKAKEKIIAQAKGVKQQIKKEIKKSKGKTADKEQRNIIDELEEAVKADETAIPKLQAILDKYKKHEEKQPVAQVTEKPSRKEVYRNGRYINIYVNKNGDEVNPDGTPLK